MSAIDAGLIRTMEDALQGPAPRGEGAEWFERQARALEKGGE
jgi:hypothetical protein